MRVLVISNMYPARDCSFGVFVKHQVDALRENGVEVLTVARKKNTIPAYGPFLFKTILRLLFHSYDVVHAHYGFHSALVPAILKRRPLVVTFHGSDALLETRRNPLYFRLQKFVVARADRLIAVSSEVEGELTKALGADSSKVSLVPCGVDSDAFRPLDRGACRELSKIDPEQKVAIFVGRLEERKGLDILFQAAERLPEVLFLLIGEGPLDSGPSNCRFLGARPNSAIPTLLCAADAFVLPSRSEGTPVVVLEAMACGLPVVATRVGGIPDLIRDWVNGFCVEAGDAAALTDRLHTLLSDRKTARQMGSRARDEVVAAYDRMKIADRVIGVLEQAGATREGSGLT